MQGRDVGAVEINKAKTEGRIAQDIPGSVLLLEKLQRIVNNVVSFIFIFIIRLNSALTDPPGTEIRLYYLAQKKRPYLRKSLYID